MTADCELVAFITVESDDDLIVAFYVCEPADPTQGRSIILHRDLKWEHLIPESQKGVTLSDEGRPYEPENNYVKRIRISDATTAEIWSRRYQHQLDVSQVDPSEIKAAKKVLRKMNSDERFKLEFL